MKSHRLQRVREQIKRELAEILRSLKMELGDYLITVTGVNMSRDLRNAEVWVSIYGEPGHRREAILRLRSSTGLVRHHLARRVTLRYIPELRFNLDETLDSAERIDGILRESGLLKGSDLEGGESDE